MSLDENGPRCPATQGLQRQGPGAGKKIDGDLAFDRVAEKIEEGLSNPVLHGPGAQIARILQFPPAKLASNDPHSNRTCRCSRRTTTRPVCRPVSFVSPSAVPLCQICFLWYGMGRGTDSGEPIRGTVQYNNSKRGPAAELSALRVWYFSITPFVQGNDHVASHIAYLSFLSFRHWVWAADPPRTGRRQQGGGIRQDPQGVERFDRQPGGSEKRVCHRDRRRQEGRNSQAVQ